MSFAAEFRRRFDIDGVQWIEEAEALAGRLAAHATIESTFDHALLVGDRFLSMAGPLEELGYAVGSDETLYLGEVEGLRYYGIAATLPSGAEARARGWFEHVLISQPAHQSASDHIQQSYGGGPVLHHVALTVSIPAGRGESDQDYALRVIPEFLRVRERVGEITGAPLQKVTMSLPDGVLASERFAAALREWTRGRDESIALEEMRGGGFFLQFASTDSYRVEVVLRHGTVLGFNPAAQTKLSRDVSYSG
jgi:hypothetical protein